MTEMRLTLDIERDVFKLDINIEKDNIVDLLRRVEELHTDLIGVAQRYFGVQKGSE